MKKYPTQLKPIIWVTIQSVSFYGINGLEK